MPVRTGWNSEYNSTKGSILVGDNNLPVNLPVGTNGQVLTANSATATGLEWAAAAAPYSSGTFIPNLSFGGASVGITYSLQQGRYTKIADVVFYEFTIVLTSKGVSVGSMSVAFTGAPAPDPAGFMSPPSAVAESFITLDAGYSYFSFGMNAAATSGFLSEHGSAVNTIGIGNTQFANNSVLQVSGLYFTA